MKAVPSQAEALAARSRRLIYDHRARAKKAGVALRYTVAGIRRLLESSPCCYYCGLLAVCCPRCNTIKGQLAEAEFRELLTLLALLHPVARADIKRRLIAGGKRYATGRKRNGPNID